MKGLISWWGRVRRAVRSRGVTALLQVQARALAARFRTAPGQDNRPVGAMPSLLQDIKARGLDCDAALDVGAHSGSWSREVRRVFPHARCFLVEPLAETQEALRVFCQENPGSRVFAAGAGAEAGTLTLSAAPDSLTGAYVVQDGATDIAHTRSVPIVTLNSLLEAGELPVPQIAKIDVQGFELHVLRGGSALFGKTEVFILEVSLFAFWAGSPVLHEVVAFMAEQGYVVYDFGGFLRRPYDGALGQMDVCFVRKDGFLRAYHGWANSGHAL